MPRLPPKADIEPFERRFAFTQYHNTYVKLGSLSSGFMVLIDKIDILKCNYVFLLKLHIGMYPSNIWPGTIPGREIEQSIGCQLIQPTLAVPPRVPIFVQVVSRPVNVVPFWEVEDQLIGHFLIIFKGRCSRWIS